MANENENEKKNVLPKKNVLVMISTHGTWGTTDKEKAAQLKEYYQDACEKVLDTLQAELTDEELRKLTRFQLNNKIFYDKLLTLLETKINLYLGYDGDGVQGELVPPTLLLLMLIDKFSSLNPKLIQCQNNYIKPFSDIVVHLSKENLEEYEKIFVDDLNSEEVETILKKDENINIYHHAKDITDDEINKIKTKLKDNNLLNYEASQDNYGGVVGNNLVGSTAGWQKHFNSGNDPKFDEVYYLPVWDDELRSEEARNKNKEYIYSITYQIKKACDKENFTNNKKKIYVIADSVKTASNRISKLKRNESLIKLEGELEAESTAGGSRSRKRNRRSKRRNLRKKRTFRSKRKSLRRKRHSKRK